MFYRTFGKTGISVSALGFGCMRFPMAGGHVLEEPTIRMLHRAMDLGVNYFDTGFGYCGGESQVALGKAIKGRRDKVLISTKNLYKGDNPTEWRKILDKSLERLGVSYIDFYNLHDLNLCEYTDHLLPRGSIREARKALDEGVIKHFCFSSHDEPANIRKLIDTGEFEGVTLQYNLLDRHNEEIMQYARDKGLGVAIMGSLGAGRLTPPSAMIDKMLPGSAKNSSEVALRFVLANPDVSVALSGMTGIEEVEENAATACRAEPLSAKERRKIESVLAQVKRLSELYCTGCGYCMPCPTGVDIPSNFIIMNLARVWDLLEPARTRYLRLSNSPGEGKLPPWADSCTGCRKCEAKCPQNIPIAERLKEVAALLSPKYRP